MKIPRALLVLGGLVSSLIVRAAPPPNIVLIVADDLGWSDVGFSGAQHVETPVLNRLAREGTVFSQFYATPTCMPTRAVLMTGQYGPRHGIYAVDAFAGTPAPLKRVIGVRSKSELGAGSRTLAEVLAAAGYDNAIVGKWHLGSTAGSRPEARGFATAVGVAGIPGQPDSGKPGSFFAPYGNIALEPETPGEYLTDRLTDEAIAFVERPRERPFFLYFPTYAVHVPLHARESFMPAAAGEPREEDPVPPYVAMMRNLDANLGRLLAALEKLPRDRPTLLVFTSDNGGQLVSTSNRPLRGQKGTVYEGGIRVPTLFWSPGQVAAGRTVDTPAAVQDLFPTLATAAGASLPAQPVDGVDLAPALRGEPLAREALFWHMPNYTGNLTTNGRVWQPPVSVIRRGDWKLIEHLDESRLELYNLAADPGETNDVAATSPNVVADLLGRLHAWQKETGAPRPSEPNPKFDAARWPKAENVNRRDPAEWKKLTRIAP